MNVDKVKFVNLTPHPIVIAKETESIVIPRSNIVARVEVTKEKVGEINEIPVYKNCYGNIENLPDPVEGIIYIVSTIVLQALKEKGIKRSDVVSPDTTNAVRDKDGNIIAVRGFQVLE